MQEKPKRKPKNDMSRRRFLQIGLATASISVGAAVAAQWANSPSMPPTPQAADCSFSWAANTTRVNEDNSAILHEALVSEGLNPTKAEVHDRAMEYLTCFDESGTVISQDLSYRNNVFALVAFTDENMAINGDVQASLVQTILDIIEGIDAFTVLELQLEISNGEDSFLASYQTR